MSNIQLLDAPLNFCYILPKVPQRRIKQLDVQHAQDQKLLLTAKKDAVQKCNIYAKSVEYYDSKRTAHMQCMRDQVKSANMRVKNPGAYC